MECGQDKMVKVLASFQNIFCYDIYKYKIEIIKQYYVIDSYIKFEFKNKNKKNKNRGKKENRPQCKAD